MEVCLKYLTFLKPDFYLNFSFTRFFIALKTFKGIIKLGVLQDDNKLYEILP